MNKYKTTEGECIGRGSPLGNPFTHKQGTKADFVVPTREKSIEAFREYLLTMLRENDPQIVAELDRLAAIAQQRPLNLKCFCAPQSCHGDVIKHVLEQALKNQEKLT